MKDLLNRIYKLTDEFINAYKAEWHRLDTNEYLYNGRHWEDDKDNNPDMPHPVTPVIFSTVENLKADMMDSYPQAIIRAESAEDEEISRIVARLVEQNHDSMNYRGEYYKLAHDIVNSGTMVQEVGYNPLANNGIGQSFIRYVNCRNILFDPQVTEDIQHGRAVIKLEARTIASLEEEYPEYKGGFANDEWSLAEDKEVQYDQDKSVLQIEFWWRELVDGRYVVHMAKAAGRKLLGDSREQKPQGYFAHGMYPFIVTANYRRKASVLGYGVSDMFGSMEEYADKIDQISVMNAFMARSEKLIVEKNCGFDMTKVRDWRTNVLECEKVDGIKWFSPAQLQNAIYQLPPVIRAAIKEESGANDFSRGSANSGVTAASAIAAMQEAASKRSRMLTDAMHQAFKEAVRMEIEVEREFNVLPRKVLVGEGSEQRPETFTSALLKRTQADGIELPIEFYISIKVQRENRWQINTHNEAIIQMVQMGILPPQSALKLMIIDGKDSIMAEAMEYQRRQEEMQQQQLALQQQQQQKAEQQEAMRTQANAEIDEIMASAKPPQG